MANLWSNTTVLTPSSDVVFEPVQGDTQAVRFTRNPAYSITLVNTGDFTVAEFTWAAKVYPHGRNDGLTPLFVWDIPSLSMCDFVGLAIWLEDYKLKFSNCDGGQLNVKKHSLEVNMSIWYDMAVAYNAATGVLQLSVGGDTETFTAVEAAAGSTAGNVVMGTYFYDTKQVSFYGKIACMRMWNTAEDLTLLQDPYLCNIN
jgi:hypothetical protein